jgi:hypothetical protein
LSYAYSPGLKVKKSTIIQKYRVLPLQGEVCVKNGDQVAYDTVVARTFLPGDVQFTPVYSELGINPSDLPKFVLKKEGDKVEKGELLALVKSFFGLFKSEYHAEYSGTIELVSPITGMVCIRESPKPVNLAAYITGKVSEVIPQQGVVIETYGALIQGIFGIGGERHGILKVLLSPNEEISAETITKDCSGKIVVGGALVTYDAIKKAEQVGVTGIVTGGIDREDLTKYMGYEMGVAITGNENIGLTCIITEGFGKMAMAHRTHAIFKDLDGTTASINGATQIRAGVIRPEIIIPQSQQSSQNYEDVLAEGMYPGTRVRIIRQPYYGAIGVINSLPVERQQVESESFVRVMVVNLDNGAEVTVPRANVEIIEE